MKVVFAVVWLLSNGQFEGEPWKLFSDMQACSDYRDSRLAPATVDRVMFFNACLDTEAQGTVDVFRFNLIDGLKTK